ncbi:MAG: Rho-binding antiterminator [Acidithiobacillus sp.]
MPDDLPYRPISCALHSVLELAAMHRRRIRLRLHDGRRMEGVIVDVWTEKGREYLRLRRDGGDEQVDLALLESVE